MLGILVQLAISWILVWLIERRNLSVLGLKPTGKRITYFFIFLLVTAALCSTKFLMRMYYGERWVVNPKYDFQLLLDGWWWNIKSVLFEELIFRGVILYILIKRIGATWAIIISAVAFGIYHWFSFGIIGQVEQMIGVFFITGLMGLLLAFAYSRTLSLYIPIAIHLGWNFTSGFVFSTGTIGDGVFIYGGVAESRTVSYFTYYFIQCFPMVSVLLVNYFLIRRLTKAHPVISHTVDAATQKSITHP